MPPDFIAPDGAFKSAVNCTGVNFDEIAVSAGPRPPPPVAPWQPLHPCESKSPFPPLEAVLVEPPLAADESPAAVAPPLAGAAAETEEPGAGAADAGRGRFAAAARTETDGVDERPAILTSAAHATTVTAPAPRAIPRRRLRRVLTVVSSRDDASSVGDKSEDEVYAYEAELTALRAANIALALHRN